jgi:hypothetical protein
VKEIEWKATSSSLQGTISFGFIWLSAFFVNNTHFVCYVAASSFYFSCTRPTPGSYGAIGQAQVMLGAKWAYTKHMGSLALGALIHAILEMLKKSAENNANR